MTPSLCSGVVQGALLWQKWEHRAPSLAHSKAPALHDLQQAEAALQLYGAAGKPGHLQFPDGQGQRAKIPGYRSDLAITGDNWAAACIV